MDWSTGTWGLVALVALCVGIVVALPWVLRYRLAVAAGVLLVAAWVVQPFSPGWPPTGWVMVACDVGQGDALVLDAGDGSAVVVDTGPEPALVDRCLDDLDIESVALLVLTHPHADHIDGVDGIDEDRPVGGLAVASGALDDPSYAGVAAWAESNHVPVHELPYGSTGSVGDLTWRVLGPPPTAVDDAGGDEAINDSSVVLAVRTSGVSLLLTGDVEAPAQAALLQWGGRALHADVLKVPHHGSADQDPEFLSAVRPRLAIVSVGADNDYGHPAPSTLDALYAGGVTVARTDQSGEIAVVVRDGELTMMTR